MRRDVIEVEGKRYVLSTSVGGAENRRVLKHGDSFLVCDRYGDINNFTDSELGLFHQGTRYLSAFEFLVNGVRPVLLSSTLKNDNTMLSVDMTNARSHDATGELVAQDSIHLFRAKVLWQGAVHEHLRMTNYTDRTVDLRISLVLDADFVDLFEVRGKVRERRGTLETPKAVDGALEFTYNGLDGRMRRTRVLLQTPPQVVGDGEVVYAVKLAPREERTIELQIGLGDAPQRAYEQVMEESAATLARSRARDCRISSTNEHVNGWINHSQSDLHMLMTRTDHGPYPYAGIPWFSTPFGRDGIITALQYLWVDPMLARGVLAYLAAHQAQEENEDQEAEPGKILHEVRQGEMAELGEIPFKRYYGTVDATPLFVVLAGEYYRRTGDLEFVRGIWSNICAALEWIDRYGDCDGDGFVEYERHNPRGLVNQAWKDSDDSVFHADGKLAEGHVALCEVQGYVYAARQIGAELAEKLGDSERAGSLRQAAEGLRRAFHEAFWCEDLGTYALALDGRKQPCRVRSSNAGHLLFSEMVDPEYARRTIETLMAPISYSGWGVRTIAASEARYSPMSYHNGSVWPHDNAMVAAGMARYGYMEGAMRIFEGLFHASLHADRHRLPELFCGFRRRPDEGPTWYPEACAPQAWAAGTVFMLLQACLGMSFNGGRGQVVFYRPTLPPYIRQLKLEGLQVGQGTVDLQLQRHKRDVAINVLDKQGPVEVIVRA